MKSDYGFDESEKLLNQLEKDVHKQYAQATEEMERRLMHIFQSLRLKMKSKEPNMSKGK